MLLICIFLHLGTLFALYAFYMVFLHIPWFCALSFHHFGFLLFLASHFVVNLHYFPFKSTLPQTHLLISYIALLTTCPRFWTQQSYQRTWWNSILELFNHLIMVFTTISKERNVYLLVLKSSAQWKLLKTFHEKKVNMCAYGSCHCLKPSNWFVSSAPLVPKWTAKASLRSMWSLFGTKTTWGSILKERRQLSSSSPSPPWTPAQHWQHFQI